MAEFDDEDPSLRVAGVEAAEVEVSGVREDVLERNGRCERSCEMSYEVQWC